MKTFLYNEVKKYDTYLTIHTKNEHEYVRQNSSKTAYQLIETENELHLYLYSDLKAILKTEQDIQHFIQRIVEEEKRIMELVENVVNWVKKSDETAFSNGHFLWAHEDVIPFSLKRHNIFTNKYKAIFMKERFIPEDFEQAEKWLWSCIKKHIGKKRVRQLFSAPNE